MNIKTLLMATWLVLIMGVLSSCEAMPITEGMVIALPDQVKTGTVYAPAKNPETSESDAALVPITALPDPVTEALQLLFGEDVEEVTVTTVSFLKDTVTLDQVFQLTPQYVNPETGESSLDGAGFFGQLLPAIGAAFPGTAPFVGLGAYLLSLLGAKRSRQHLSNGAKAVTPYDGKIDLKEGAVNFAKAVGWVHSTEDPEELELVAMKKKAVAHAKNGGMKEMSKAYKGTPEEKEDAEAA